MARWMSMVTNIQSEYVVTIAFPQLQLLHEHGLQLRYKFIVCLVNGNFSMILTSTSKGSLASGLSGKNFGSNIDLYITDPHLFTAQICTNLLARSIEHQGTA